MKKLFFLFLHINSTHALVQKESINIREGNLAMRTSQQPAPLFSFGQITVDNGNIQAFLKPVFITDHQKFFSTLIPSVVYGVTNRLTLEIALPGAPKLKQRHACSSGLGDMWTELEYVFYEKPTPTYNNLISLVGIAYFPTGSASKCPPTGNGAPAIFLGIAARHRAIKWYYWLSPGFTYSFPNQGTHVGTNVVYQFGIGRNLAYISEKQIVTAICEVLGSYTTATSLHGVKDSSSRSNFISIAPEIWISSEHVIFKAGGVIPLLQHVHDSSHKNNYQISFILGYTFN